MKHILFSCFCLSLFHVQNLFSNPTFCLIGGGKGVDPYVAYVSTSGTVNPVNLNQSNLQVGAVAINSSGLGFIGSQLANPSGANLDFINLQSVINYRINHQVNALAFNNSGIGIFGGQAGNSSSAAFITSDGSVYNINTNLPQGIIWSVAINDSGNGIIGGQNYLTGSYAALVSFPNSTSTVLSGLPSASFSIVSAAINKNGTALIGGGFDPSMYPSVAYAAFVQPSGSVIPLTLNLSGGTIKSVAINSTGLGIIGGRDNTSGSAYASLVTSGQSPNVLTNLPTTSNSGILSVAMNDSGAGIIGGQGGSNGAAAFAALVASNGSVTPLALNISSGIINSVAINPQGVGIIGGQNGVAAYAAIVLPDGVVIPLDLQIPNGSIYSVAITIGGIGPLPPVNFNGISGPKQISSSGIFQNQHFNFLSWEASVGAVYYNVYRDNVLIGSTSSLTYTDLAINWKQGYFYSIRGVDAAGNVGSPTTSIYVSSR